MNHYFSATLIAGAVALLGNSSAWAQSVSVNTGGGGVGTAVTPAGVATGPSLAQSGVTIAPGPGGLLIVGDSFVTGTFDVLGTSTLAGVDNTGGGIVNAGAISGATGITNAGNIATTTLNSSGNATVGSLTVTGAATTNGLNNGGNVISGVAPGVVATDAANVGQLNTVVANQAIVNNNQAVLNAQMAGQITENRRMASTGTAIVAAAAALPSLEAGKRFGVGVGVGGYDGRSAVSVGFAARVTQSLQVKLHIGTGSGGKTAGGAGAMWAW